ncbi:MAG: purine-binding chemotaxis protein CheW [Gammaproteobacteria bacterium]|nr:purine-binding chemotaxis protein CheW [Gammaproteobacteria bacterium]NVK89047.1 purine-binding chemotaxis protein CheW [Gammaproteobacteria bacterium]
MSDVEMDSLPIEIEYNEDQQLEDLGAEFLGFDLQGETYCVDILSVKEIRGWTEPTLLPNAPSYVKGIINIRGDIVPIIDIRERYGMDHSAYTKSTVIMILSVMEGNRQRVMGLVVDAVNDVLNIKAEEIKDPPKSGHKISDENIEGLYNANNKVYVILSVSSLLDLTDIESHYRKQFSLESVE